MIRQPPMRVNFRGSRRTPTTPSLRRGQTEWYGPTVKGCADLSSIALAKEEGLA
jgi:hypothetical protein